MNKESGALLANSLSRNHQPSAERASVQHGMFHLTLAKDQFPTATDTGTKWASVSLTKSFILETALCSSDTFLLALKV